MEKVLTADARYKIFKEKLKKLGYVKKSAMEVKKNHRENR